MLHKLSKCIFLNKPFKNSVCIYYYSISKMERVRFHDKSYSWLLAPWSPTSDSCIPCSSIPLAAPHESLL